jgi:hypothetical protein
MARESFEFKKSYYTAIVKLPVELRAEMMSMICEYVFEGKEPQFEEYPVLAGFWDLVVPMIDANNARRENGKKGGRPRKNLE